MRVLYIGGSGEISLSCVEAAVKARHEVTVFNRGLNQESLPITVTNIVGDFADDVSYGKLASHNFDVVCQFLAYDLKQVQRDIEVFSGNCKQYIFISTASAYEKSRDANPPRGHIITEETPLNNPYWAYSRSKAACESLLLEAQAGGKLPVTIVRPSHTYRRRLPSTVIHCDHLVWRILKGKPVIVHGDGESLWTLTHSSDFANAFIALCGLESSLGQCIHITASEVHTWNSILRRIYCLLDEAPNIVPVLSRTLVDYEPTWEGPLLGDKSNSVIFNNNKVERLTGGWQCTISLEHGLELAWVHTKERLQAGYQPDAKLDAMIDRIIENQSTQHRHSAQQ